MRISDIAGRIVKFSSIEEKNKTKSKLARLHSNASKNKREDSLQVNTKISAELAQLKEMGNKFSRNSVGLQGLKELQSIISRYESRGITQDDWKTLSEELKNISLNTKYKGENIISYVSTPVNDSKSLYALKMNLESEIKAISTTLGEERKKIASHLVKMENRDALIGFTPEKTAARIVETLNTENSKKLFSQFSNVNHLLGIGS